MRRYDKSRHDGPRDHGRWNDGRCDGPSHDVPYDVRSVDDGDGQISLQEFQAAHERIFKAMDSNKDGKVTQEEMQAFMHGRPGRPASQQ